MGCEDSQISVPNRKRRLDHLTLEEKLQRKKLKNRVAAQSSRDRKKARLDDLETEVRILKEKNEALTLQCHNLQLEKKQLASENQELRQKLSGLECNHQTHDVGCSTQVEPAAFSMDPLPQGQALQRALGPGSQVLTMWQVLKYCLISQISSIVLMEICAYLTWMNWLKAYSEKPLKWTQSTDSPVQRNHQGIKEDRRRTIEEIVELSGVTWSSVQRILTEDLGMKRLAAKFVPRLLTAEQKQDMKGKRFADVPEVKEKTTEALSSISKDEFRQCFEKWNKRLNKCTSVSGEYCEGD
ncbi:hypothetical protein B7P43_G04638 [Cryptotermes secundus]|uniref:X-box-binding protein 1 n=1 Tax=Cryptotermes secundus TaxID=105785 RepID=A0A2J7QZB9_9NEOP|nr:hypothetical protein B7P43_G04638 [Cryptotermes secundus]